MMREFSINAERLSSVTEYYFSTKLREIEAMKRSGRDVINLGIGSPDLPPPQSVVEVMAKSAILDDHHQYQPYKGIPKLREAFSKWYSTHYSVLLDPEKEVLPLMGSKEGIMHIAMAFINEGDHVLVPDPGYPTYAAASKLAGGIVTTYPLSEGSGWLPDYEILEKSDLSKVKIMWVNYPHMPTGSTMSGIDFRKLIDFTRRNKIILVNDNPYSFILNDLPISILGYVNKSDYVLELNSLSKSHNMAGWRIGVVSGNPDLISSILLFKSNMDSGMFLPIQLSAIQALEEGEKWYSQLNNTYRKRRDFAWKLLDELNIKYSKEQTGLFVWGKIPNCWNSSETMSNAILQSAGVFITPGHIFGEMGKKYIRVSLCSNDSTWQRAYKKISESKNKQLEKI